MLLGLGFLLGTSALRATSSLELFRIERSTNRNAVVYAARVGKDGELDAANPVTAFWIMNEAGGVREELTFLERSFAYGYATSRDDAGVVLRLTAFDQRALRVVRRGDRFVATVRIAGRTAQLRRIWVQAEGGLLGPSVRYVQLDGVDATTGEPLSERITRNTRGARRAR